jgi:hypothetical protein
MLHPAPSADAERDVDSGDPRAALLLNLLLTSLEQPQPNLTHLLCSFDFDAGEWPAGWRRLLLSAWCHVMFVLWLCITLSVPCYVVWAGVCLVFS